MIMLMMAFMFALLTPSCSRELQPSPTPTEKPLIGKLTFAGSTTMQPLAAKLSEAFRRQHPQVIFDIAAGGTVVGIQAVHNGTTDIGMASRQLSPEESSGVNIYVVCIDALAIVINSENPVSSITQAQLQDIYMGKITNWKELGGNDLEIIPIQREVSSGTRGAFDDLALEKQEALAASLETVITAGDMAAAVASEPAAIGYLGFGNLESNIKILEIDGVLPSQGTIHDGTYPLFRPLSLLTAPTSQPLAMDFIDFVLSPEGQSYVEEFGWIPINK